MVPFFIFIVGYLTFYYGMLILAAVLNESILAESWTILGDKTEIAKNVLIYAPLATPLTGFFIARVFLQGHIKMGSDRVGALQSFSTGWLAFIVANWLGNVLGLNVFLPREIGEVWIQFIGVTKFNFWVNFVSPSFGYFGGVVFSFIGIAVSEAQRT